MKHTRTSVFSDSGKINEAQILQRVKGRRPAVAADPALEAERTSLIAAGVEQSVIRGLYRQFSVLEKCARLRLRVDDLRARVSKAWVLHGFAGTPQLASILNQASAARVLVDGGASRDDLITALGITPGLASNYASRARSLNKPSGRIDMAREISPDDELSLFDLQTELRALIKRCRQVGAYVCALGAAECLITTLEASHAVQQPTPATVSDDDPVDHADHITTDELAKLAAFADESIEDDISMSDVDAFIAGLPSPTETPPDATP